MSVLAHLILTAHRASESLLQQIFGGIIHTINCTHFKAYNWMIIGLCGCCETVTARLRTRPSTLNGFPRGPGQF